MVAQKLHGFWGAGDRHRNDKLERKQHHRGTRDTIDTCVVIAKRGGGSDDEKEKFAELQKGIKALILASLCRAISEMMML